MAELLTYRTFSTTEEAEEMADTLMAAGIHAEVVQKIPQLAAVYAGTDFADGYDLKIAGADFNRANDLLYAHTDIDIATVVPGHPLHGMTTEELRAIVAARDEWGPVYYNTALAMLRAKGVDIPERRLEQMREERVHLLGRRQSLSWFLVWVGYASAISPILTNMERYHTDGIIGYTPGFLGIIIGLLATRAKTTLPDGTQVLTYDDASQKHGARIITLNVASWIVNTIIIIFNVLEMKHH